MPTSRSGQHSYQCSFCGKSQGQVGRLIAGPDRVFICDECVTLCSQIITEETPATPARDPSGLMAKGVSPRWLYKKLDDYVVGQENLESYLDGRAAVFTEIFPEGVGPPNTLVFVDALFEPEMLVEIEVVAALP